MSVREAFDRTAREYDLNRRQLIPCFDAFYGTALDAIPFGADDPISVLDLGAGTGLLAALVREQHPRARLRLVDVAPEMLARAEERFAERPDGVELEKRDFSRGLGDRRHDCVVSALAIHHLTAGAKQDLFAAVHALLPPGGAFVNADQVAGETPEEDARHRQQWLDETRALGTTPAEIETALERMEEDQPSTVSEQLRWLRAAGFAEAACPFQHGMFAVFAARKAPA